MTRIHGPAPVALLAVLGTIGGLMILEAGGRVLAFQEARRQGRLDRDLDSFKSPSRGAAVTLGQIIQRSESPRIVYELRPRLDVVFAGARLTTSGSGYRGPDVATPKPPGVYRILGIGDSYMFGQGVSDGDTYLTRLPSLLAHAMGERKAETANLAVPGYNTVMEVAALHTRGDALRPDLVLIEIVGNDLDLPNFLWSALDPWTLRRSFLLDLVRSRLGSGERGPSHGLVESPQESGSSQASFGREAGVVPRQYAGMVGLNAFDRAIADLAGYGRSRRIPVLALTHGVWFEAEMLRALDRNGVAALVLRSALRRRARAGGAPDYRRSPLALSPADLHPSALGHLAVAEELATWLEPQIRDWASRPH